MAESPRPLDELLLADLAALPSSAQLRLGAFRFFARLLATAPTSAFLAEVRDAGLAESLAQLAENTMSPAAVPLRALAQWLSSADEAAFEAVRRDFLALFVSTRHLPAPPWESVYTSPDRLVNQQAARDALQAYAEAGVTFDGWKSNPADHISLELSFAATLIAESARSEVAKARLEQFETKHLAGWAPRFCADLAQAATSPLYQRLAEALPRLVRVVAGA